MIACSIASHFGLNPGCCLDWAWIKRNLPEGLRDVAKNTRLTWKKTWYRQLFAPIHAKRLSLRPWLVVSIILSISPCLKIGWSQPKYDKTMKKWWMAGIIPPASFRFNQKCCFVSLLFGLTCVNMFGDCSSLKIIVTWWVWICFATHNLPGMMIPQHIHIYIYISIYTCACTCTHAYMHACIHTYILIYIPIDILLNPTKYPYIVFTLPLFSELIMLLYCVVRYPVVYIYVHTQLFIYISHFPLMLVIYDLFIKCMSNHVWPLLAGDISIFARYMFYHPQSWVDTPTDQVVGPLPSGSGINLSKKTTPHNPFRLHILIINIGFMSHLVSRNTINIH